MGLTWAVAAQKVCGRWEVVVKLPRKAGRDQDKQLLPAGSPHSTEGAEPRMLKIPAQYTEAKADNMDNQAQRRKT